MRSTYRPSANNQNNSAQSGFVRHEVEDNAAKLRRHKQPRCHNISAAAAENYYY